jgi:hypothetical protein
MFWEWQRCLRLLDLEYDSSDRMEEEEEEQT